MPQASLSLDKIHIRNLLLNGIIGINPHERENRQKILINVILFADTRHAGKTDRIEETVNYGTVTRRLIEHVEKGTPLLIERLAAELVRLCLSVDERIEAVEVTVEKPDATRLADAVGITIFRTRTEIIGLEN